MSKLNLPPIIGEVKATALNTWKSLIEAFAENSVSRDDTLPNHLLGDLDMNSNRILNLPTPVNEGEPLRLGDRLDSAEITSQVAIAEGYAQDAAQSASDTNISALNAADSATFAGEEADRAELAANTIPVPEAGDAGKTVVVNSLENGYELKDVYSDIVFQKEYDSSSSLSSSTITQNASYSFTHGLSALPKFVELIFVLDALGGDLGWPAGIEVNSKVFTGHTPYMLRANATSVFVSFADVSPVFGFFRGDTGATANLNLGQWKFYVRAFA